MALNDKLIINVALTGMIPMKQDNPAVPISPVEIGDDVKRCSDLGASMFHIHARNPDGMPTYRIEVFQEIIEKIRSLVSDCILCVTTSGRVHNEFAKRSEVLGLSGKLKPEMASLTLGSMNFPKEASVNSPTMIQSLAAKMNECGIVPEQEIFDMGMVDYSKFLLEKGAIKPPLYYNLLLGSLGTIQATPLNLAMMVNSLPQGAMWAAAGIGKYQFSMNALAITMGGNVRTGLEDSIYMDAEKKRPATNPDLVERLIKVARAIGREPASPAEARTMIGLK
jgi:3-keto-5-aminohexanoate cleavage enzyme